MAWPTIAEDAPFSAADFNGFIAAVNERRAAVNLAALPLLAEDQLWSRHNVSDLQDALEALAPLYFNTYEYADPAAIMDGQASTDMPPDLFYTVTTLLAAAGLPNGWRKKVGSLAAAFTFGKCIEDDLEGTWLLQDLKAVCQALAATFGSGYWIDASNERFGKSTQSTMAAAKTAAEAAFDAATVADSASPCACTVQKQVFSGNATAAMIRRKAIPQWSVPGLATAIPRAIDLLLMPVGFGPYLHPEYWGTFGTVGVGSDTFDANGDWPTTPEGHYLRTEHLGALTGAGGAFANGVGRVDPHPAWSADPYNNQVQRGYWTIFGTVLAWTFSYA